MSQPGTYIALLRGINVGGRHRIPMTELKAVCEGLGWSSVRTCLQTGNVVFRSEGSLSSPATESQLESAIVAHFGFEIPVVIRSVSEFEEVLERCPLHEVASADPSRAIVYLSKRAPDELALQILATRAAAGERVCLEDTALWIYFPNGVGGSKLSPAVIDKAVGSAATGRNWNTALKIRGLAVG